MQELLEADLAIDELRRLVAFVRPVKRETPLDRPFPKEARLYEVFECDIDELDHRYGPDWHEEPYAIAHAEWQRLKPYLETEEAHPTYQLSEQELLFYGRCGMRIVGRPYVTSFNHWRTLKARRTDALPKALDPRSLPHACDTYYQHVTKDTPKKEK